MHHPCLQLFYFCLIDRLVDLEIMRQILLPIPIAVLVAAIFNYGNPNWDATFLANLFASYIGFVFLIPLVQETRGNLIFSKKAIVTEGKIIEVSKFNEDPEDSSFIYYVEFIDQNKNPIQFRDPVITDLFLQVNDTVTVEYDPDDSNNAKIKNGSLNFEINYLFIFIIASALIAVNLIITKSLN